MDREGDGRIWGYALSKRSGVARRAVPPARPDDRRGAAGIRLERQDEAESWPPRRYDRLTEAGRMESGAVVRQAQREQRFAGIQLLVQVESRDQALIGAAHHRSLPPFASSASHSSFRYLLVGMKVGRTAQMCENFIGRLKIIADSPQIAYS